MNVRAHLLVPPHFLVSTAFKKMRWKDEFGKWLPKLPNISKAFSYEGHSAKILACKYFFILFPPLFSAQ